MMNGPIVWQERFRVRANEVDAGGRASVVAVCNWLQEVAGNHATSLGWAVDQLAAQGLTWVLARLHLRLQSRPAWRDEITVTTWPCGAQRLFALRDYRICGQDGGELGVGTSGWLLLNLASRRPARPSPEIVEAGSRAPGRSLASSFAALPELTTVDSEQRFAVRFADLDINQHANNVSFVAWLLEALGADDLRAELAELEVDYRAEARYGDEMLSQIKRVESVPATFLHRLLRAEDGRELARARTVWRA
jgi:medium-chain acyl-[acyl-carrier-protein] hydrolase